MRVRSSTPCVGDVPENDGYRDVADARAVL